MTKITKRAPNKNMGGSYVADGGKIKKVEGTREPKISAPRDKNGDRLDRLPNKIPQGGASRVSGAIVAPSNKKGDKK